MNRLRIAVIGAGHLGRIHARLLRQLDQVELIAVVDPLATARDRVAAECQTVGLVHMEQLAGRIDAAVVATPTHSHFQVAGALLNQGVHVLVEKPLTATVEEADRLIAAARRNDRILQVGHVERFNPAWNAVAPHMDLPQYIEAVRAGCYTFRSTDVSVVLDLMIHDLDLILSLVESDVVDVEALGVAVFGPHEDLAHARLRFANGCIANLNASRVSYQPQRTMQIFGRSAFAAINFADGEARLVRPGDELLAGGVDLESVPPDERKQVQDSMFNHLLRLEPIKVESVNAILEEQREFAAAVLQGGPVRVPGGDGRDALAVAERVLQSIRTHRWNGPLPAGSHVIPTPAATRSGRAA